MGRIGFHEIPQEKLVQPPATQLTAGLVLRSLRIYNDGHQIEWYTWPNARPRGAASGYFLCSHNERGPEQGFLWVRGGDISMAAKRYREWLRKGARQDPIHMELFLSRLSVEDQAA